MNKGEIFASGRYTGKVIWFSNPPSNEDVCTTRGKRNKVDMCRGSDKEVGRGKLYTRMCVCVRARAL